MGGRGGSSAAGGARGGGGGRSAARGVHDGRGAGGATRDRQRHRRGHGGGLKLIAALSQFDRLRRPAVVGEGRGPRPRAAMGARPAPAGTEMLSPASPATGPKARPRSAAAAQPAPATTVAADQRRRRHRCRHDERRDTPPGPAERPLLLLDQRRRGRGRRARRREDRRPPARRHRRADRCAWWTSRAASRSEVGKLDLGPSAWGSQLLVAGDRALVLAPSGDLVWRDGGPAVLEAGRRAAAPRPAAPTSRSPPRCCARSTCPTRLRPGSSATLRVEGAARRRRGWSARRPGVVLQSTPVEAAVRVTVDAERRAAGARRRTAR